MKRICEGLTEPRRALQPTGTQWFSWIGLFVVQAISLVPSRRPIDLTASLQAFFWKSQIFKSIRSKNESPFQLKDFFVIFHEHKDSFFEKKKLWTHFQISPLSIRFFSKYQRIKDCLYINEKLQNNLSIGKGLKIFIFGSYGPRLMAWTTKSPIRVNHWVPLGCRAHVGYVKMNLLG